MNYYEELLATIDELINTKDYKQALSMIEKELSLPYVPSDVENRLKYYLKVIPKDNDYKQLNEEDIINYLKADQSKQLRAVEALNSLNLRDYIDICNEYLKSDGFINAKVLLIYSLIKQEINEECFMNNEGVEYSFIPKYVMSPEESLGFKKALEILEKDYMKEPSKLELAKQLLYKECLLALPINYEEDEANNLASKIYNFIEDAFA